MAISLSEVIAQNTYGFSEGRPVGVPASYHWYNGLFRPVGDDAPPASFTAVTGWGQVYQKAGTTAYYNPNATVEVANSQTYVRIKATGEWVLVQNQAQGNSVVGGHFVADFSGNAAIPMKTQVQPNGNTAMAAPPNGYNDHFWYSTRGTYPAGAVDAVYVQMDMRVNDPNLHLIANIGADWWRSASAPYVDGFGNNPAAGMSNWVELSTSWRTLGYYSSTTESFQASPPPPLLGVPTEPDTIRPTILAFASDSGVVGDGTTNATAIKLDGTASPGSNVTVYDGSTKIGTAAANNAGAWTLTTGSLSNGKHNFTARIGDNGPVSSTFAVTIDTTKPTAPTIASFSPDGGTVGDGVTNARQLTLAGTAEAGSAVSIFDRGAQIGTAVASANGAWSFTTSSLSNAIHTFTANATDAAGNVSAYSSNLNVIVDATDPLPAPVAENLLVNGSFEQTSVQAGRWGGFDAIAGWTAVSGGKIELWNKLNGVNATNGAIFGELDFLGARDGLYQDVKTVAGQQYELSFDTRSRPGLNGDTCAIEILWNGSIIATVPPGHSWENYNFSVTGTGGQDRLTFREAQGQSADGLGALYDNVSLVAKGGQVVPTPEPNPVGSELLVNGSFEQSAVQSGRWAGFSAVPGWTAVSGGVIELWNQLNGVSATDGMVFGELDYLGARDGFYQSVQTVAGQRYDVAFDARSRPGLTRSTCTIEVLWNDEVIASVPPGSNWQRYDFSVVGTGGADRLTFREAAGQSSDGLGALYDNVSLVASSSLMTSEANRAASLIAQYSAATTERSGSVNSSQERDESTTLVQTLASSSG